MRSHQRKKPIWLYAAFVVIGAGAFYLSFELGRYQAGYSKLDERRREAALEQTIAERDKALDELRRQQAILETSHEIDQETYSQVEANLGDLQAKIQAQEEELAFYRGIVSPGDGISGLRIQDLEVLPEDAERRHLLRLILVQAIVHNKRVAGTVRIKLSGSLDGEPAEFALGDLVAAGGDTEIDYGFRYFQSLEEDLVLPVGFEPATVEVEVRPREPRGDPVMQSFPWESVLVSTG
jgi:hypothetical protein